MDMIPVVTAVGWSTSDSGCKWPLSQWRDCTHRTALRLRTSIVVVERAAIVMEAAFQACKDEVDIAHNTGSHRVT